MMRGWSWLGDKSKKLGIYCKTCFDRAPHKSGVHYTEVVLNNGQVWRECTECAFVQCIGTIGMNLD